MEDRTLTMAGRKKVCMTKIKICGLRSFNDINMANKYHPDYIGFVFANSKRQVDPKTAFNLKNELDPTIQGVGVFVNAPIEYIVPLCQSQTIDIIQLHGDEDEAYIQELKRNVSNPIIKAARVSKEMGFLPSIEYSSDYILYDTVIKGQFGGSGITFDHRLLINQSKPFFLAGGLDRENVRKAILICNPYCVDVSSGVETNGIKDEAKIREFIQAIREM